MRTPEILQSLGDSNALVFEGFFETPAMTLGENLSDEHVQPFVIERTGVTQALPRDSFRGFGINE